MSLAHKPTATQLSELIGRSLREVAHEYFRWTRGDTLYDSGVERLLDTSIARSLANTFCDDSSSKVYLNYNTLRVDGISEIVGKREFRHGFFDVYAHICGVDVIIETKNGLGISRIKNDVKRVVDFVFGAKEVGRDVFGFVAGCEFQWRGNVYDYNQGYCSDLIDRMDLPEQLTFECHVSDPEPLDARFQHKRDRVQSLVLSFS